MVLCVTRNTSVSIEGGNYAWKVKQDLLTTVNEIEFVKLQPTNYSFIRFVCDGIIELKDIPKNASLSQNTGLAELVRLRNSTHLATVATPMCALFASSSAQPETVHKQKKRSASEIVESRKAPTVLSVTLPAGELQGGAVVKVIAPVHPCDDIIVELGQLEYIVLFIREKGISLDTLMTKRIYGGDDTPSGVWRNGCKGFVVKVQQK